MKNLKAVIYIFCLTLLACSDDSSSSSSTTTSVTSATVIDSDGTESSIEESDNVIDITVDSSLDYKIVEIDHDGSGSIELNISTDEASDVYFVFTNTSKTSTLSAPDISGSSISSDSSKISTSEITESTGDDSTSFTPKGIESVREFNAKDFEFTESSVNKSTLDTDVSISYSYTVDSSTESFYDADDNSIDATLRGSVIDATSGRNLYVWVDDDSWSGFSFPSSSQVDSDGSYQIDSSIVSAIADKFLVSGSTSDIYNWVTNICGDEWGSHSYSSQLIASTDDIHILLTDIDSDGAPSSGGTLGYYYSRDNFFNTIYTYSNEKLMFYIDSAYLSAVTDSESSWDITNYYSKIVVSTLAHEFQHMINFYQKAVLNGGGSSSTWLNEMCSMAIEDLVGYNMEVGWVRGVDYDESTAGSSGNTIGRIPGYNYYNDDSFTSWSSSGSYSLGYAFGAYLIRNFGGAELIQQLVQNSKTDYTSVTAALSTLGYTNYDFDDVFRRLGTANILSDLVGDSTLETSKMQLNSGTWFTDDMSYKVGSINTYNYDYGSLSGPKIKTSSSSINDFEPVSHAYYLADDDLNGSETYTISDLDSDVQVTVIVRDDS